MNIGLALAGLAAVAAATHPRGMKQLMGLMGSPEEHLAKFREYLAMASNADLPIRFRFALIERAWAEAEWTSVPADEQSRARDLQSHIEESIHSGRVQLPVKAPLVVREPKGVDTRHPPAGWKRNHVFKGVGWLITSLGGGNYEALSTTGIRFVGTGNTVLSKIHGHSMNVYDALKLGKERAVFNPMSPPPGWFL